MFDESDGTELDDDECLSAYEKGAVFILGRHWRPAIAAQEEFKQETDTMGEVAQVSDTNPTDEVDQGYEFKPETDETDPMGEVDQGYEFKQETDKTDPTWDIDQGLEEGNLEMPSDAAGEYKSTSVAFISS